MVHPYFGKCIALSESIRYDKPACHYRWNIWAMRSIVSCWQTGWPSGV